MSTSINKTVALKKTEVVERTVTIELAAEGVILTPAWTSCITWPNLVLREMEETEKKDGELNKSWISRNIFEKIANRQCRFWNSRYKIVSYFVLTGQFLMSA